MGSIPTCPRQKNQNKTNEECGPKDCPPIYITKQKEGFKMKNIKIRDFTPADRPNYLRLSKEFYSTDAVIHGVPEENFIRTFDKCIEQSPYLRGLAIVLDDEFAGYGLLSFTWSNEVGGLVILLEEAYLSPQYQGHGLGSELLSFVEEEYHDVAKRLRLEVTSVNQRAVKLYTKKGYHKIDYLQMIKELS